MNTKIDEGLEVIDLTNLDWEHIPICEAVWNLDGTEEPCSNPAKFICSVRCCAFQILLCEDCFFQNREHLKLYGGTLKCNKCDSGLSLPYEDHVKIVGRT